MKRNIFVNRIFNKYWILLENVYLWFSTFILQFKFRILLTTDLRKRANKFFALDDKRTGSLTALCLPPMLPLTCHPRERESYKSKIKISRVSCVMMITVIARIEFCAKIGLFPINNNIHIPIQTYLTYFNIVIVQMSKHDVHRQDCVCI